ncbi:Chondroitin polymerase [Mycoplasmopsis californica]|uniref:Glycosyltransferase n=1 Tax=Mycoplasmopsis equigenitalium TaxID=114883 RepID=A0ABY5J5R1_9BACT|nr:glycosyltransferase family 2 protein [Mycoplasmopsis equigenitalium]UUD37221.1 glycosyltransferase [Mycoplasmopsis equigenitalium]VEU69474.1 Chondroitin polymerase [Mycoplasmopsis californica]
MNEPLVTILMPVYNASEYIDYTIESVLKQTDPNFKVLIIDDCSSDNTYEHVKEKVKNDPRFVVEKLEQNIGLGAMRDLLISKCNTKYFFFLDDDDFLYKNAMKKMIKTAKKTDADLVTSKTKYRFGSPQWGITIYPPFYKYHRVLHARDFMINNIVYFWGHFIKKSYYDSLNLTIGSALYEDIGPVTELFLKAKSFAHANVNGIRYLRRKQSLSSFEHNNLNMKLKHLILGYARSFDYINKSNATNLEKQQMIDSKMYSFLAILVLFYKKLKGVHKKQIVSYVKEKVKPLAKKVNFKPKFSMASWKIFVNSHSKIVKPLKE